MAIALGRSAKAQQGASSPASPIAVTITINAGETGVCVVCFAGATPGTVSGMPAGWSLQKAITNSTCRTEIWCTAAGGAAAVTSVSIAYTKNTSDSVEAMVGAYTGVLSIGNSVTGTGTASNPSIALVTQDNDNWVIGGFGFADGTVATPVPTAGTGNLRQADAVSAAGANDSSEALTDNTAASPGSVTNSVTFSASAGTKWAVTALELRSTTGLVTLFISNPIQGGSNAGLLATVAPTASTSTTGWTVGTTAVNQYSRQTYNSEIPTTGFTGTAQPSSSPVNLGEDCYRLSAATSGTFSAGTWYSSVSVIAVSSGGIQQGRARFRIWKSSNADGTSATEITQGTMIGSQVTELNTAIAQTSSASTQVGAVTLTNEFLYYQVAWETL